MDVDKQTSACGIFVYFLGYSVVYTIRTLLEEHTAHISSDQTKAKVSYVLAANITDAL